MRRPLLSVLLFLVLSLAVAFAVSSDTRARSCSASGAGSCAMSCPRSTIAARPTLVYVGERHGNPAVVPHAFVY